MKVLHRMTGVIAGVATIVFLLITAFEIAAYSDYGWYEKAYEKYEVLDDLEMNMPHVMEVTKEMMAYLRGNRDDLVVQTVVDGEEREFFNDREKAHMVDVQKLFLGGLWLRRGILLLIVLAMVFLLKTKADWKKLLPQSFFIASVSFVAFTVGASVAIMSDFNRYFTLFHEIFFDNDLWLLDPNTDLLIRMLPEGFFLDMVVRIGVIFLALMSILLIISITMLIKQSNKKN